MINNNYFSVTVNSVFHENPLQNVEKSSSHFYLIGTFPVEEVYFLFYVNNLLIIKTFIGTNILKMQQICLNEGNLS